MTYSTKTPVRAGVAAGVFDAFPGGNCNSKITRASTTFQAANRARRQLLVEQLHRLGPAPLAHFIRDIERGSNVDATLETYAELPVDFIKAYAGDRFAPPAFLLRGASL
jgi:hypothetical protein